MGIEPSTGKRYRRSKPQVLKIQLSILSEKYEEREEQKSQLRCSRKLDEQRECTVALVTEYTTEYTLSLIDDSIGQAVSLHERWFLLLTIQDSKKSVQ